MKPYLIWAPSFRHTSGGIRVLHRLGYELSKKGVEAHMAAPTTNPEWEANVLTTGEIARYIHEGAIVVYPEIVRGNPLGASHVVRYVLNKPGLLGGDSEYPESEKVVYFSTIFSEPKDFTMFLPSIEPEYFYPKKEGARSGSLVWWGKGSGAKQIPETIGAKEITAAWPETREKMGNTLRDAEVFYSYDNLTGLTEEARMCGCPTVIIPNGFTTKERYESSEVGTLGLAWGVEELEQARKTVDQFYDHYLSLITKFDKNLDEFITFTQP